MHPKIRQDWVQADLFTVSDLPKDGGHIDMQQLHQFFSEIPTDLYLFCCSLQQLYG